MFRRPERPLTDGIPAQQISESQSQRSNQYILQSTLPNEFRTADILTPAQVPTTDAESAYVGLYSLIISVIMLSGGRLSEMRLDRFLKRMNADDTTPVDSKDRLLARMIKDGYIVRIKDSSSGEDVVDYMVGPRGKVEVGQDGVADLVRMVYGAGATEEVERRLARSLGISERPGHAVDAVEGEAARGTQGVGRAGRSAGRRRAAEDEDEDG
ncbi:hypothetical protein K505DRAFT_330761 [Melanomma pulvis-pyrius CBS 109.77]|uniref:MAGE domain-containing protein n=1 Tax=Melanomma pulvis-pyrius CBS 109.77 TaxID=1314802 RepID=A0A6A6WP23_9PLEO|nr:hypothetical protein K505DRAFT_330761 [Melanomma pulvis-pyrius CBS 109.77]